MIYKVPVKPYKAPLRTAYTGKGIGKGINNNLTGGEIMQENIGAGEEKRRKQVPNEMERLEKATEELMAIVEET